MVHDIGKERLIKRAVIFHYWHISMMERSFMKSHHYVLFHKEGCLNTQDNEIDQQ